MAWRRFGMGLAILVVAGCGGGDSSPPGFVPPDANPDPVNGQCNVASDVCFLPYPSSVFTQADATAATGLHVAIPQDAAYPSFDVASFNAADGYSPSTAIVTHFPEGVSAEGLPSPDDRVAAYEASIADDAPVLIVDVDATSPDYGRRIPYFAEARQSTEDPSESLLILTPLTPLEPASRYAVIVTDAVSGAGGAPLTPDPDVQALVAPDPPDGSLAELWSYYDVVRRILPPLGIDRAHVVQAWDFPTRSDADMTADLLAMRSEVLDWLATNLPAPVITATTMDKGNVRYDFDYQNPIFRVGKYDPLSRDMAGRPVIDHVDTLHGIAVVPPGDGPLVPWVFGHGFGMSGESLLPLIGAVDLSEGPYALGLFDWDLHGSRGGGASDLIGLIDPDTLDSLSAVFEQSFVDELVFAANLRALNDTPELSGRIDGSGHLYAGVSMGGVFGTAVTAIDPDLRASVLNVGGGGIINIVRFSSLFESLGVRQIFEDLVTAPGGSNTGLPGDLDGELLMIIAQFAIDEGDAINYGRHMIRDRFADMPPEAPPILLQESIGDGIVPNMTTENLARVSGLPLIEPAVVPVPGLDTAMSPTGGMPSHGLAQFQVFPPGPAAHIALGSGYVQRQILDFYQSVLDADPANDGDIRYTCPTADGSCGLLGP